MGGVVDSIFGGGGGDSSSGSAASSNNNVTVNPTTNVTVNVPTQPLADAMAANAAAATVTGEGIAKAVTAFSTANAAAIGAMKEQFSLTMTALKENTDKGTKVTLGAALIGAAALIYASKR